MTRYVVYYRAADGALQEEAYASLTEATIRKAALRRQGIAARIVPVRETQEA